MFRCTVNRTFHHANPSTLKHFIRIFFFSLSLIWGVGWWVIQKKPLRRASKPLPVLYFHKAMTKTCSDDQESIQLILEPFNWSPIPYIVQRPLVQHIFRSRPCKTNKLLYFSNWNGCCIHVWVSHQSNIYLWLCPMQPSYRIEKNRFQVQFFNGLAIFQ